MTKHGDCDLCKRVGVELFHNDYTGLSLCESCDLTVDNGEACRKQVWDALQAQTGVVLTAAEVFGLWRTILDDSVIRVKLQNQIEAERKVIEAKIALREELTPTEAAADVYNAKTAGLREALQLLDV